MSDEYYGHFFIKLDSTKVKKHLTRENFAIIETKCGNDKYIRYYTEHWDYFEKIKEKLTLTNVQLIDGHRLISILLKMEF